MRALRAFALLTVLLIGSAACAAPAPPPKATPTPSGTLRVLGSANEEYVRGMVRAFETETGIRTTYVRISSGEALSRIRSERDAPKFSVWWGGPADGYIAAADEGLLESYRPRGSAKVAQQYRDPSDRWTGIWVGALGFAVNRKVLADRGVPAPTSWADLLLPQYRGQITMGHPDTSGTGYTVLSTIIQLHDKDVDSAFTYLRAFNQNVSVYSREGAVAAKLAAKGVVGIGIAFAHDIVAAMEDEQSDVGLVFPSEGTGYEIGGMALINNAPAPELGKRFLDWAMSDRAQELGPLFTAYQIPTNPDAKVPQQSVRLSSVTTIDYDFRWAGQRRQALVNRFSALIAPAPRPLDSQT